MLSLNFVSLLIYFFFLYLIQYSFSLVCNFFYSSNYLKCILSFPYPLNPWSILLLHHRRMVFSYYIVSALDQIALRFFNVAISMQSCHFPSVKTFWFIRTSASFDMLMPVYGFIACFQWNLPHCLQTISFTLSSSIFHQQPPILNIPCSENHLYHPSISSCIKAILLGGLHLVFHS